MFSSLRDEVATAAESDNVISTLPPANQLLKVQLLRCINFNCLSLQDFMPLTHI